MDGRMVIDCTVRGLSFFVALASFAQAPSGVFEIELWPDEGRPRFQDFGGQAPISFFTRARRNTSAGLFVAFSIQRCSCCTVNV